MKKVTDLTGQKFTRLTVIQRADDYISPNGKHLIRWLCECDCEQHSKIIVNAHCLKSGHTQSCGCLQKDRTSGANKQNKYSKKYNKYNLSQNYGIGYTSNTHKKFYFDLEDYDMIKDYTWSEGKEGYIVAKFANGCEYKLHRLIMNCSDDMIVDHINHNLSDNRKTNLRICTFSQNNMNRKLSKNNTSGTTGVYQSKKTNKWIAKITINHRTIYLGSYDDLNEAIQTRKQAQDKYFGEFQFKEI